MVRTLARLDVWVAACAAALVSLACGGGGTAQGPGATAGAPSGEEQIVDEKAEEARAFCEHEVEKAVNQPPDFLSKKQITACLLAVRPKLEKDCCKGIQREVVLQIIIDKSGEVKSAFPVGDAADCPEAHCVQDVVQAVRFPAFKGGAQQKIKYPFQLGQ